MLHSAGLPKMYDMYESRNCDNVCCKQWSCWLAELIRCRLLQMTFLIVMYNIPAALCINSDQTGVPLTPCDNYTRAPAGAKEVTATGYGDKRQITATPTTAADGTVLPLQVRLPSPVTIYRFFR
jgi:hypothetical protein